MPSNKVKQKQQFFSEGKVHIALTKRPSDDGDGQITLLPKSTHTQLATWWCHTSTDPCLNVKVNTNDEAQC